MPDKKAIFLLKYNRRMIMKRNGAVKKTDGMNSNGPVNRVRIDGFREIINGSSIQVSGPFFLYPHSFFLLPGIVALGIGFGAAYPDFKTEVSFLINLAASAGSA